MEDYFALRLSKPLEQFFQEFYGLQLEPQFETPPKREYGQVALPCFQLAKQLKKSPQVLAAEISQAFARSAYKPAALEKVQAEGAYVNFTLLGSDLARYVFEQLAKDPLLSPPSTPAEPYGQSLIGKGQKVRVEFSSPNTNKPLHLGHARNQTLGLFLSRCLAFLGYQVQQATLINDRGVHICKSMLAYQLDPEPKIPSAAWKGDHLVGWYYVDFEKRRQANPALEQGAQELLVLWEKGDPTTVELWKKLTDWVLEGIAVTYQRAGIVFDQILYESQTYQGGKQMVYDALAQGLAYRKEDGAIATALDFPAPPAGKQPNPAEEIGEKILLRKDGTSVYMTQDLNSTVRAYQDFPFDQAWWIVGNEQEHHFKVLFFLLKKFGLVEPKVELRHISYGMVELPDGKMKSREGTTVDLDSLYDEMHRLALETLKQKAHGEARSDEQLQKVAEAIGQASIHYYLLRTNAAKNILFDPKESLQFEGMTGPYLQYTYARISSLLQKAQFEKLLEVDWEAFTFDPDELDLLNLALKFPKTLVQAATMPNPALLAHYVYELCQAFNTIYAKLEILRSDDAQQRNLRLNLAVLVKIILHRSFYFMNIEPLERM